MTTSITITALTNIGANVSYTTLVPVVNMTGTPETQKASLQVLGNLILENAGGSYFVPAGQAVLAQSVTNAAQPNITSVGTLTSLTVNGNVGSSNLNTGNIVSLGEINANIISTYSIAASGVASIPTYTTLDAQALVGTMGQIISVIDSPIVQGRLAFWDGTNVRWSYVSDNSAV